MNREGDHYFAEGNGEKEIAREGEREREIADLLRARAKAHRFLVQPGLCEQRSAIL